MYPSNRSQDLAAESGRRESDEARGSFRPVALPALAAAVHINTAAAQAARARLAARRTTPIVHEDDPVI